MIQDTGSNPYPKQTPMREEITVTARLAYDCNAEHPLDVQTALIYGDMHRLLKRDPHSHVECIEVDIAYSASEAETYGNDESRSLAERQSARLQAALGGTAYPDDYDDPTTLLRNALTDLRHYADQNGLAFAEADKAAHGIYMAEKST